jgi:hypothetical protein
MTVAGGDDTHGSQAGALTVRAGDGTPGSNNGQGGNLVVRGGNAGTAANVVGGDATFNGGSGAGTNAGGAANVLGGTGGSTGGGGLTTVRGGTGGSTSGTGGGLTLQGGPAGAAAASGGNLLLQTTTTGSGTTQVTRLTVLGTTGALQINTGWSDTKNAPAFSATPTISCAAGNSYAVTMTANITSITFSNVPAAGNVFTLTMFLTQDGTGSRTVTWPGAVKWPGGAAPTLTTTINKTDIIQLVTHDGGTTWYGSAVGLNY